VSALRQATFGTKGERSTDRTVRELYDRLPYPAGPKPFSHPDRLATIAVLYGMDPPRIDCCRVLELGCSDGGNIIPMALNLPSSSFLGIDLSSRQIEMGARLIGKLDLGNIELREMNILDVNAKLGQFDYILAHGVFSWVTQPVQDKLLEIIQERLSPTGVAFVSYNTFPGWHSNQVMRDMMLYHCRATSDPRKRAERSVELVRFLDDSIGKEETAYAMFLRTFRSEIERLPHRLSYFFHEYLAESNMPCYFSEFVERIEGVGLEYLSDADPAVYYGNHLPRPMAEKLKSWAADRIEFEQYIDFVRNSAFRRSLLCHRGVVPDQERRFTCMQRLHASTQTVPMDSDNDNPSEGTQKFKTSDNRTFTCDQPLSRALLLRLVRVWPNTVTFDDLLSLSQRTSASDDTLDSSPPFGVFDESLTATLRSLFFSGVIELHASEVQCARKPGERPCTTSLVRHQATVGPGVTDQLHRTVNVDDAAARLLLRHLDGTRDRIALSDILENAVSSGRLNIKYKNKPILEAKNLKDVLRRIVDSHLQKLTECALLIR